MGAMHKRHGTALMWASVGRWKIVGSIVLAALLLTLPALPALSIQPVRAATGVVASLNDDSTSGTLRQVIAAAQPNDTITFMAGLSGKIVLNNTQITFPTNRRSRGRERRALLSAATTCTGYSRLIAGAWWRSVG